ncbi:ectonucleotide pyrophosphatase/phosphodiesterase family member 7 [Phocoena sinus]|uniref:ectonucleotide pyrophosphatase/phosphodiesterase family member 7 n=1 Tax=Phocoena sinus TaxID=42100 RepID=UPI0013C42912|nr:ectonucleotide pyrophosphatase/phosphodiesterase family member 7 [Phocoena sinus]
MRSPAVLLAVALATLLVPASGAPIQRQGSRNKLLLVTFDGFRWNYDQDVHTPNLDTMALDGVKARYMTPAFVTMTSPCHFTLVTGKYIENHGVVHNMFYNTSSKVKLPYHATLGVQKWWDNGSLPIWITAQRQGLKTGSFFYPGGNVTYQGEAVTLSRKEGILHNYKDEKEWRANIDTVMKWFTDEGLDLVTLYFGEPDSTGHKYGPESQQRKDMVRQVDRTVGYLRDSIRNSSLEGSLNLIIVSDHGMSTVNKKASDLVEIHKIANFTFKDIEFELLDYGPNGMLLPKEGKLEKVYKVLKDAHPRLHVYKKELFPKSFHYASHPRVTPLLMYSDPGYVIHGRVNVQFNKGEHGFDNNVMDMKTIFRAVGPSFKRGLEVEPFESIHVYELMCRLLGIVPEANDGLLGTLLPTLQEAGDGVLGTRLPTTPSGAPLPSTSTHCTSRQLQVICACTALTSVPSLPLGVIFSSPAPGSWEQTPRVPDIPTGPVHFVHLGGAGRRADGWSALLPRSWPPLVTGLLVAAVLLVKVAWWEMEGEENGEVNDESEDRGLSCPMKDGATYGENCPMEVPPSVATGAGGVSGACSGRRRRPDGGRAIGPQPPPPMGGEEALPGVPCPKSACLQPGAISIWAHQVLHPGHREERAGSSPPSWNRSAEALLRLHTSQQQALCAPESLGGETARILRPPPQACRAPDSGRRVPQASRVTKEGSASRPQRGRLIRRLPTPHPRHGTICCHGYPPHSQQPEPEVHLGRQRTAEPA